MQSEKKQYQRDFIKKCRKAMDDKRNHTLAQIEEAEKFLQKLK